MGMSCTICNHPNRLQIDQEIVQGISHTKIAKKYDVSNQAVRSHAANHLSRQLVKAYEMQSSSENMDLMNRIDKMIDNAETIFKRNFDAKKDYLALSALNSQKGIIELLAKISAHLHQSRAMELEATQREDDYETKEAISKLELCELNLLGDIQDKLAGKIPWKRLLPDSFYAEEEEDYIDIHVAVPKDSDIEHARIVVRPLDEGGATSIKTSKLVDGFVDVGNDNDPVSVEDLIDEPEQQQIEPEPEPTTIMKRRRKSLAKITYGPGMPEGKKHQAAKEYVRQHGRMPREKWLRDAL